VLHHLEQRHAVGGMAKKCVGGGGVASPRTAACSRWNGQEVCGLPPQGAAVWSTQEGGPCSTVSGISSDTLCSALPFAKGRTPVLSAIPWITDSTTVQNIVIIAIVSNVTSQKQLHK
jgi:hypothetical protein